MVRELVLRKTSCMSLNSLHGDERQLVASQSYMEAWVFYVFWTLEQNRVIQYLSVCNRIFKEPEVKTRSYVVICIPQWSTHASVSKSLMSASLWALQLTQRIPHGRALCFSIPRSLLLSKFLLCSRSISSFLRQVPAALSFAFHIPLLEQKLPDASFQTLVFMLEQHQPVPYPQISLLCSLQWGSKLLCKKIEKKNVLLVWEALHSRSLLSTLRHHCHPFLKRTEK